MLWKLTLYYKEKKKISGCIVRFALVCAVCEQKINCQLAAKRIF